MTKTQEETAVTDHYPFFGDAGGSSERRAVYDHLGTIILQYPSDVDLHVETLRELAGTAEDMARDIEMNHTDEEQETWDGMSKEERLYVAVQVSPQDSFSDCEAVAYTDDLGNLGGNEEEVREHLRTFGWTNP